MLKYLSTEWNDFAYDLEYPGSNEDKFFYYLRSLGYKGSVDDMLYSALVDKGYSLSDVLSLTPEDVFEEEEEEE